MTVADFLRLTRQSWLILLIGVLVGAGLGAAYTAMQPRVFSASSSGFITSPGGADLFSSGGGSGDGTSASVTRVGSYVPLINSRQVFERIAADPAIDLQGQPLEGRLSATVVEGTSMLQVTATAASGEAAAALANGALEALIDVIGEIEQQAGGTSNLMVIPMENASVPQSPAPRGGVRHLAFGTLGGLALAYAYVLIRRITDNRVRTAEQLAEISGVGLLGRVPKHDPTSPNERETALAGESFRRVRTNLRFANVDREVRSVLVTSANQSEGKSTITSELGRVLAESGQPTVIIDADLRRPRLGDLFDLDDRIGLSEVLSGQVQLADALRGTEQPGLVVLPAGSTPPNPSEMIGSEAMAAVIERLSRDFFVLVDAPPVLPVTDPALLSRRIDAVVLVAAHGATRLEEFASAVQMLRQVEAPLIGTVLNRVPLRGSGDAYEYRRYRGYYLSDDDRKRRAKSGRKSGRKSAAPTPRPVAASARPAASAPAARPTQAAAPAAPVASAAAPASARAAAPAQAAASASPAASATAAPAQARPSTPQQPHPQQPHPRPTAAAPQQPAAAGRDATGDDEPLDQPLRRRNRRRS